MMFTGELSESKILNLRNNFRDTSFILKYFSND